LNDELRKGIWRLKSWFTNWEEEYEYLKVEKLIYELRKAIWTLKSGTINWEE
jgi:hypothetical protein